MSSKAQRAYEKAKAERKKLGNEIRSRRPIPPFGSLTQVEYSALSGVLMDERFIVLETGKCSLKCECELIELGPNKEKVCPMTWEPCGHTHLKDFANG